MKNGVQIIKEHLEESLRLTISEDIEYGLYDENNKDIAHIPPPNKWYEKLFGYFVLTFFMIFWFFLHLLLLPFFLWPNLYRLYLRIKYKIPFIPELCPGPCKAIDLINNKIKIEIRTNDHLPPHFHVSIDKKETAFTIMKCNQINGDIENKYIKSIKKWYKKNRNVLICQWNLTRPSDKEYTKIKQ